MILSSIFSAAALLVAGVHSFDNLAGEVDERIWNGRNARPGQFPYQTLIFMQANNGKNAFCGGSLISTTYVLTAAHCCVNIRQMVIYMGLTNFKDRNESFVVSQTITSQNMIIHEQYDPRTISNDICLLKLLSAVQTNANISTVALPTQQDTNPSQYDFNTATISGWGQTNDFEGLHDALQYASVTLKPHILCSLSYVFINKVSNSQLCSAKLPWSGPCHGDSGGPLTVKNSAGQPVELGLVSWGVGSCLSFNPVVYTYVPAYLDWINSHMT